MSKGIDYGMGKTNIDHKTGIRYGVIPQNDVLQAWADDSEAVYPDPEMIECPECEGSGTMADTSGGTPEGFTCDCPECEGSGEVQDDEAYENSEPTHYEYTQDGYNATCGDDGDIFITKSPYYTRAKFCSPCAPGACYLRDYIEDGEKAYCFGHDWFEDGKAPYPVYRVADDTLVEA